MRGGKIKTQRGANVFIILTTFNTSADGFYNAHCQFTHKKVFPSLI